MITNKDKETLFLRIVQKRTEMMKLANANGLGCNKTIKCSQELDLLLNSFDKVQFANQISLPQTQQ